MTLAPIPPRWARLLLLAGGLAVFFWLRLEDHGVATAALMGGVLAAMAGARWVWPRIAGRAFAPRALAVRLALAGALLGSLTSAFSALLMLLKDGFHGHLYPDYPVEVIGGILALAPVWGLAGALLGLGIALALLAARSRTRPTTPSPQSRAGGLRSD